jgi:ubiquinone/menaquinone biosynthesis C-methylase UbiE
VAGLKRLRFPCQEGSGSQLTADKKMNVFTDPKIAEDYDRFYQTPFGKAIDEIEKRIILDHTRTLTYNQMLELGCGTGHWTGFFSSQGFEITATDISQTMLQIAETKGIKNAVFLKADASSLNFPDNTFPVIASITMLEFVANTETVLNEIYRVLKPGGHLVLGCLNALSELGKAKSNDEIFKHARFFTPSEIGQLLLMFGATPYMSYGVYLSSGFGLLDGTSKQNSVEPAFIAVSVQKTNQ